MRQIANEKVKKNKVFMKQKVLKTIILHGFKGVFLGLLTI